MFSFREFVGPETGEGKVYHQRRESTRFVEFEDAGSLFSTPWIGILNGHRGCSSSEMLRDAGDHDKMSVDGDPSGLAIDEANRETLEADHRRESVSEGTGQLSMTTLHQSGGAFVIAA